MMPPNMRHVHALEVWKRTQPIGVRARVRPVMGEPYMVTTEGDPWLASWSGVAMILAVPDRLESSKGEPVAVPYWLIDLDPVVAGGEL